MDEENIQDDHFDYEDAAEAMLKADEDDTDLSNDADEDASDQEDVTDEDESEDTDPDDQTNDDDDESDNDESDEDDQSSDDDDGNESDEDEKPVADDDAEVVVKVGDEEKRVSVADLKRLAGQETALTQKAQSLSAQRKAIESQGLYVTKILESRYNAAKERADKYKDVDLYRASRELDDDDFESLKSAKEAAEAELSTIEQEANDFVSNAHQTRKQILREQAKESLKTLTEAIPEWSDELYGQLRTYAVKQGMDKDSVNEITDPGAFIMMHKAMKHDEAQQKSETVKKKVVKAPKKAGKKSSKVTDSKASRKKSLQKNAAQSGEIDDVAAAFEAAMDEA